MVKEYITENGDIISERELKKRFVKVSKEQYNRYKDG